MARLARRLLQLGQTEIVGIMSLNKKMLERLCRKGWRCFGIPSDDGRYIDDVYLSDRPKAPRHVPLVSFGEERGLYFINDLQLPTRDGRNLTTIIHDKKQWRHASRDCYGDPFIFPITINPTQYYGPKVQRMAC